MINYKEENAKIEKYSKSVKKRGEITIYWKNDFQIGIYNKKNDGWLLGAFPCLDGAKKFLATKNLLNPVITRGTYDY